MMNRTLIPAFSLCLLFTGCGEEGSDPLAAAKNTVGDAAGKMEGALGDLTNIDLSSLSGDALKSKVGEMGTALTDKLGGIKDLASAESIKESIMPLLDKLTDAKGLLGDNMPDLSSLKDAAIKLKDKFAGDQGIMDAIKPLLDKITALK